MEDLRLGHRLPRRGARRGLAACLAVLVPVAVACHTYRRIESGVPDPGTSVRVRLADSATRARAGWEAAGSGELAGRALRHTGDSLVLSVPGLTGGAGSLFRDTIAVPTSLVRRVEEEELSVWRSALLTAGVVTGTFLLLELGGSEASGGLRTPGDEPPESRWPDR